MWWYLSFVWNYFEQRIKKTEEWFLKWLLDFLMSWNFCPIAYLKEPKLRLCLVAQLGPTLCDPMDCTRCPDSSVHGDSPGKNTRVGWNALLQGIFPTQGSNPGLPHCRQIPYYLIFKITSQESLLGPPKPSWFPSAFPTLGWNCLLPITRGCSKIHLCTQDQGLWVWNGRMRTGPRHIHDYIQNA